MPRLYGKNGKYEIVGEYNCEWDTVARDWKVLNPDEIATVLLKRFDGDEIEFAIVNDGSKGWCSYRTRGESIDYSCKVELEL